MKMLDGPVGLHQFRRQPVQQFRMRRRTTTVAKIKIQFPVGAEYKCMNSINSPERQSQRVQHDARGGPRVVTKEARQRLVG